VLELAEHATAVEEAGEVVEKADGGGKQAIALAALQGREHGGAVFGDQTPGCADDLGGHGSVIAQNLDHV